jgi:hypothetical protein
MALVNSVKTTDQLPRNRGFSLVEAKVGSVGPSAMMSSKIGFNVAASLRRASPLAEALEADNTPAFSIQTGMKIPSKDEVRQADDKTTRMESLMRVPKHRPAAIKYDFDPVNRTLVPFTHEDTDQFGNLPLINTLREPVRYNGVPKATVTQPPGFFEADMAKWEKKFEKATTDRKNFKRVTMSSTHFNVLNANENLKATFDLDKSLASTKYTGGQLIPKTSEFKQVLKRRNSR